MRPMDGRGARKERGEEHGHGKGMPAGQAARSAIRKSGSGDLGRRKAGLADERRACATQPHHYQGTSGGGFLFSIFFFRLQQQTVNVWNFKLQTRITAAMW